MIFNCNFYSKIFTVTFTEKDIDEYKLTNLTNQMYQHGIITNLDLQQKPKADEGYSHIKTKFSPPQNVQCW